MYQSHSDINIRNKRHNNDSNFHNNSNIKNNNLNNLTDFTHSVYILHKSFKTWMNLQINGIVTKKNYDVNGHKSLIFKFALLHKGSTQSDSILVGQGKFSNVYKMNEWVYKNIKVPYLLVLNNREDQNQAYRSFIRCCLREVCFVHSFNHPNIIRFHQSQVLMVHGRFKRLIHKMPSARYDLGTIIKTQEITSFKIFVQIIRDIIEGLHYMHTNHVYHGDIKPSNILITHDYRAIITDFNLSLFDNQGIETSRASIYWRSPENLLQENHTCKSDIWSVGMIILDCLYGTTFAENILHVKDDLDFLSKFIYMMGKPSFKWCQDNIIKRGLSHLLFSSTDHYSCLLNYKSKKIRIPMTMEELCIVKDLLSRMLIFEPNERSSAFDLLDHPLFCTFESKINNDDILKVNRNRNLVVKELKTIYWNDNNEKNYILHQILLHYQCIFGKPLQNDWLKQECLILSKRVIDKLKKLEVTFNPINIINLCCNIHFLFWKDYWYENSYFESEIFHILNLLNFEIFWFNNVHEEFLDRMEKNDHINVTDSTISKQNCHFKLNNGTIISL
jgi:serine/threonine protein kinase